MSAKRKRLEEWVRLDTQEVCNKVIMPEEKVVYVDATQRKYQTAYDTDPNLVRFIRMEKFVPDPSKIHSDGTPMSLCAQYILWLDDGLGMDAALSKYSEIELWTYEDILFLFRQRQPGFFARQPSNFEALVVHEEYQPDACFVLPGFARSTSMALLAFYYLKILPPELRPHVYLNPSYIKSPPIGKVNDKFEEQEQELMTNLQDFINNTEKRNAIGVSYVSEAGAHAQVIVYDAPNKRLEIYDSDTEGPLNPSYTMPTTLYGYLAASGPMLQERFGICRLYGNGLRVQGLLREEMYGKRPKGSRDPSCALWATVIAMCRMTGVDRDRLPILFQDVIDTSVLIRSVFLNACGIGQLENNKLISKKAFDSIIEDCTPSPIDVDAILRSVTKHQQKTPIPIPPDRLLCDEEKQEPCTDIYVNLNELIITSHIAHYLFKVCPNTTRITVQVPDDNSLDIDQIKYFDKFDRDGVSLTFVLSNGLLDLDNVTIGYAISQLLLYTKQMTIHTPKAIVTNSFVDKNMLGIKKWERLHADRILLTAPISAIKYKQAADFLKTTSKNVFGDIQRDSDLNYAKTSGLNQFVFRLQEFVLPDTFEGFPVPTTFITKW
jgi:hypothetical protein